MVSSKDVAKHAGVSQTTVSRVLNTPERVKKPTLKKVMDAIDKLNYIPDGNARSLVQRKTRTIALISGPLHNPFFSETTTAIINYANAEGFRTNVHFINDDNSDAVYNSVFENKVDGIILSSIYLDDPIFNKLEKSGIPFILFNRKHQSEKNYVEIDNRQAGYLAATHLLDKGHKNIVWIGGPLTISTFKGRMEGFIRALQDHQIAIPKERIVITDTKKEELYDTFLALQKSAEKPTAICAATDAIAIRLMDFYISAGVRIPKDISIIGIDNVELSRHASLNLTTIGMEDERGLGFLAVEKLFEMIYQKNKSCVQIQKSVRLFERNTTMDHKFI